MSGNSNGGFKMIIYKPYGSSKFHPMRNEVKKLYQKYKDKIELGATAEFPPKGITELDSVP